MCALLANLQAPIIEDKDYCGVQVPFSAKSEGGWDISRGQLPSAMLIICTRDECSVNLLADDREVASNKDGDNITPDVGPSPCEIDTAVNLQVAHLQDGPTDTHRKGSGQPLLAQGIMDDNGETTVTKKKHRLAISSTIVPVC